MCFEKNMINLKINILKFFVYVVFLTFLNTNSSLTNEIVTGYDEKGVVQRNIGIATSFTREAMAISKNICMDLGFVKGTVNFDFCTLKVMKKNSEINNDEESIREIKRQSYIWGLKNQSFKTGNTQSNTNEFGKVTQQDNKYLRVPEKVLCIQYINNYGFFSESKQAQRLEAIQKRSIDCNKYNDEAYYDLERRNANFHKALQDAFHGIMDAQIQKHESITENYRNANRNLSCSSRVSAGKIRTSCY